MVNSFHSPIYLLFNLKNQSLDFNKDSNPRHAAMTLLLEKKVLKFKGSSPKNIAILLCYMLVWKLNITCSSVLSVIGTSLNYMLDQSY